MMTKRSVGENLIEQLLSNPVKFNDSGLAYNLLQQFFEGLPLAYLQSLLKDDNSYVKRAAIWIASELGRDAAVLLDDILPLMQFEDRYIKFYTIECITVCAIGENAPKFIHVVQALQDNDPVIRVRAMELMVNAHISQLEAALSGVKDGDPFADIHRFGLSTLIPGDKVTFETAAKMVDDRSALVKKYGAILVKRLSAQYPELVERYRLADDPDLQSFFGQEE